ncbi:hypothetical protein LZ30DRAFT_787535 [Colletotrichum cereale]|nr:hypothetical protein LZ30DRAFT_787535 [Colletotrichum cereale]
MLVPQVLCPERCHGITGATEHFAIGVFLNVTGNGFKPHPDVFVKNAATAVEEDLFSMTEAPRSAPEPPANASPGPARRRKLEVAPGKTFSVVEDKKWLMMDIREPFFDITDWLDVPAVAPPSDSKPLAALPFPTVMIQTRHVKALIHKLRKDIIRADLERFSSFHNRYYLSRPGVESAEWLHGQARAVIDAAGHPTAYVRYSALILTPPSKETTAVVLICDGNGAGSVMILELLRVLLLFDKRIASGDLLNTVEFHWYAAGEAGLLGSQQIFNQYRAIKRQVVSMLNQDMVGYVGRDGVESFGVVTDWTHPDQVAYMKRVIYAYTDIPYEETVCGYACSDHASATRNGFPSAFISEAPFGKHNPYIHKLNDTMENVSFDHVLQHAKMTMGYVYELAYWPFA